MESEKINIDDLEIGDIVFLNNVYGYCSVLKINLGVNRGTVVFFEAIGIGFNGYVNPVNKVIPKYYAMGSNRKFKLFE